MRGRIKKAGTMLADIAEEYLFANLISVKFSRLYA
jgi:hypothetical protein